MRLGPGVALIDYDNDGWLDIYLLHGSTVLAMKGKEPAPRAMLLHNNHDGTSTDVTDQAGVVNERWGFGVAVGDYDNDGWPDIYVSNFGTNRLYHNITTAPLPTLRIELGDAPHALLRSDRSGRPDSGRVTGPLAALLRRGEGEAGACPPRFFVG
jgi:FG-GAP-like repeat